MARPARRRRSAHSCYRGGVTLFSEVTSALQKLKDQFPVKDLSQLEEMLIKEKAKIMDSLAKAVDRNRESSSVDDILNVNWLYQDLLLELYVWDRRLHQLVDSAAEAGERMSSIASLENRCIKELEKFSEAGTASALLDDAWKDKHYNDQHNTNYSEASISSDDLSSYDTSLLLSSSLHLEIDVNGTTTLKGRYSVICVHSNQFYNLRRKCCPSELAYVASLSRCKRWDAQGGKSKAFFARTIDGRLIIKQIKKTEFDSFIKFAPDYFRHVNHSLDTGSQTCLAKILGIYQHYDEPADSVMELLEHLEGEAKSDTRKLHPLVDEFIPTIDGENGICYTHPERLPGTCEQGRACPALLPPAVQGVHDGDEEAAEGAQRRRRRQDAVAQDGQDQAGAVQQQAPRVQEILVLYTNYGKQRKPENNWVMHQYHLGSDEEERDDELIVSKVFFQTHPRQCGYTMARESAVIVPAAAAVTGSSNAFIAGHHKSGGGGSSVLRQANGGADQLYSPGAMMGYDQGAWKQGTSCPCRASPLHA
ncbi:NAC domain-containing protein 73 [Zea mays]|uniref:NAC domain-containing protein 73 n=1 Tax=Zea mays TaxID=4577 RepID=A0A3L6E713_MAIZE|nr:NAC domain-containing protein 73 [Zea mays]